MEWMDGKWKKLLCSNPYELVSLVRFFIDYNFLIIYNIQID